MYWQKTVQWSCMRYWKPLHINKFPSIRKLLYNIIRECNSFVSPVCLNCYVVHTMLLFESWKYISVLVKLMIMEIKTRIFLHITHLIKKRSLNEPQLNIMSLSINIHFCWKSILCTTLLLYSFYYYTFRSNQIIQVIFSYFVSLPAFQLFFSSMNALRHHSYFLLRHRSLGLSCSSIALRERVQPFLPEKCPFFRTLHLGMQIPLSCVVHLISVHQCL